MRAIKLGLVLMTGATALMLGGCGDKKEVKDEYEVVMSNKEVLLYYDEDSLIPQVVEEKSDEEILEESVEKYLGKKNEMTELPKTGILDGQGLVVEVGIGERYDIPKYSVSLEDTDTDIAKRQKEEAFDRAIKRKVTDGIMTMKINNSKDKGTDANEQTVKEIREEMKQIEGMIGKEKSYVDLDKWSFSSDIEERYKEDLQGIREMISRNKELEKLQREKQEVLEKKIDSDSREIYEKELEELNKSSERQKARLKSETEKLRKKLEKDNKVTKDEVTGKESSIEREVERKKLKENAQGGKEKDGKEEKGDK